MTINRRLLEIIGRRFPAYYDVFPRGPQAAGALDRHASAYLNPQPLPPLELGSAVAGEFIHLTWLATRLGHNPSTFLDDLDDWCGTVPRYPRLPIWWPHWWPPVPEPEPHPDWLGAYQLGLASRLAVTLPLATDQKLAGLLNKALDHTLASLDKTLG